MNKLAQQLQAAQTAFAATQARVEGLHSTGDAEGLPAAEAAFLSARKELRRLEALRDAAEHKAEAQALTRRSDAFVDAQSAIARRQRQVFGLIQAYREELVTLAAEDRALIEEYADLDDDLPTAEQRWRWRSEDVERVLESRPVQRWMNPGGGIVPDGVKITPDETNPRRGSMQHQVGAALVAVPVSLADCLEERFLPARAGYEPAPLVETLSIPADPPVLAERKPQMRVVRERGGLRMVTPVAA